MQSPWWILTSMPRDTKGFRQHNSHTRRPLRTNTNHRAKCSSTDSLASLQIINLAPASRNNRGNLSEIPSRSKIHTANRCSKHLHSTTSRLSHPHNINNHINGQALRLLTQDTGNTRMLEPLMTPRSRFTNRHGSPGTKIKVPAEGNIRRDSSRESRLPG